MSTPTTDTVDNTLSFLSYFDRIVSPDNDDTPSFLTYSDRTISTDTVLTMDSSFITDSTIGNSTCIFDSTPSTSSDTDSLFIPTVSATSIPSSLTDTDHTTIESLPTYTELTMDTFIRPSDSYYCSTPRSTSPTSTDLTMDSSFITDSTIANSTCILDNTLSSITFDTDSLSTQTDTVITIPSLPTETDSKTTPCTRRRRAAVLLTLYFVLPPFLIVLLLSPLLLLLG